MRKVIRKRAWSYLSSFQVFLYLWILSISLTAEVSSRRIFVSMNKQMLKKLENKQICLQFMMQ